MTFPESAVRPKVGVGVIALRCCDDGATEILLGKRKKEFGFGKWSLPGGHLEYRESWAECAARELKEETGLDVSEHEPIFIGATNDLEGDFHYVTIYVGFDVGMDAEPENLEPEKCFGWEWFELEGVEKQPNLWAPLKELFESAFAQRQLCSLAPPF